jgi:hypothetical protein
MGDPMNQPSSKSAHRFDESAVEHITLDCDQILTHAGGDPERLIRLCGVFLNELPLRVECLEGAMADRDKLGIDRALQQLRVCLIVFGSGELSCTMEMLEAAVRGGRASQVKREWKHLERQIQTLVPQVQHLMLETTTPKSAVQ